MTPKLGFRLLKTWVQWRAIHSVRPWASHITSVSLLSPATGLASACYCRDNSCYVSCELVAGCIEMASIPHTPSLSPPVHQPPRFAQLTSYTLSNILGASLVAQIVKNLPAVDDDTLSCIPWKIWTKWVRTHYCLLIETEVQHIACLRFKKKKKNLPAKWETWVWPLGQEDPLKKGMVTPSNILAWRIPWTEEPGRLQPMGSQRVIHDWMT